MLSTIWTRYERKSMIGSGVYGKVYRAVHKTSRRVVAIKEQVSDCDGSLATTMREISILSRVINQNLINFLEADQCSVNNVVYIAMEYCPEDLQQFLTKNNHSVISSDTIRMFAMHMLTGIEEIHRHGLIHRDIKPQNILVAQRENGHYLLKLADFGLSRRIGAILASATPETQTMLYRAPELFVGVPRYSYAIDIWSIACIIAEIVRGEPIFRGSREIEFFDSIIRTLGEPTKEEWEVFDSDHLHPEIPSNYERPRLDEIVPFCSPEGLALLALMFKYDPVDRVTAAECLAHPYFSNYKEDVLSKECFLRED